MGRLLQPKMKCCIKSWTIWIIPGAFDDPAPRKNKLHAISADYFAEQMVQFYKQSQVLYDELKLDQDELLELEDMDTKK